MRAAIRRRRRPNGHAGMRRKRVRKSTSRKIEADWKRSNKECNSNMSVTSQRRRAERKQKVVTGTHRDVACWWDPYWASQCFAPAGFGSSSDDRRLTQPRSPQHHPPLPQRQPLLPQYQPPRPQRRAALLHRRSYGNRRPRQMTRAPSRQTVWSRRPPVLSRLSIHLRPPTRWWSPLREAKQTPKPRTSVYRPNFRSSLGAGPR